MKVLKKCFITCFIIIICLLGCLATVNADAVEVTADAAVLIDGTTGSVLFAKNMHQRMPPASTTKIMTAILALELGKLNDIVTVSEKAASTEESSIYLSPGEKLTLEELVEGALINSGNDACVAIAEYLAGSEEAFAKLMNQKAQEIGAFNTHFVNPHGLHDPNHYTSAYDLAIMARYALRNPKFAQIVSTKEKTITWYGKDWDRILSNTNKLLWIYEGADGVKTGTTDAAGPCLVSSATRGGQQLIAVVLHSDQRWDDSIRLLNYGFDNYQLVQLGSREEVITTVEVKQGIQKNLNLVLAKNLVVVMPKQGQPKIEKRIRVEASITAPIARGAKLGELSVIANDQEICKVDLVASEEVPKRTFFRFFLQHYLRILPRVPM